MSSEGVILLVLSVILIGTTTLVGAVCILLLWAARRIRPAYDVQTDLDQLKQAYERLRGQKARSYSSGRPRKEAEPPKEPPWFANLPPNEQALFRELEGQVAENDGE